MSDLDLIGSFPTQPPRRDFNKNIKIIANGENTGLLAFVVQLFGNEPHALCCSLEKCNAHFMVYRL